MQTVSPIYYAGFEVGSGFSGLKLLSADGLTLARDLVTLPSYLVDGDMTSLLKSSDPEAKLVDVLQPEEYVLTWQDHMYFLVSLYERTRRQQVKQALSQHYRFTFNGRTREVLVRCGYVAMEGQGILIHCGDTSSTQAIIDVGERTADLVAANGQRLLVRFCKGEQFGVGQLVEDLQHLGQQYHRKVSVEKAHSLLTAYAHHRIFPRIPLGTGSIPDDEIVGVIEGSIGRVARPLTSFVVGTWNVEGASAGTQFETIYLGGGGAYYFEEVIRQALQECHIVTVPDPEYANICGYAELAASLNEDHWEAN